MFVASLICNPKERTLDAALVAALRNAWGGGDVRWLAPDEPALHCRGFWIRPHPRR